VKGADITAGAVALSVLSILGFIAWALVYMPIPQENQNAITVLLGVVAAQVSGVVGYYFGSSASSKAKDETISNMSSKP
jgi:hypothetical protein